MGDFGSPRLEAKGYTSPRKKDPVVAGRKKLWTQIRDLRMGTTYTFRVEALNRVGTSVMSFS